MRLTVEVAKDDLLEFLYSNRRRHAAFEVAATEVALALEEALSRAYAPALPPAPHEERYGWVESTPTGEVVFCSDCGCPFDAPCHEAWYQRETMPP